MTRPRRTDAGRDIPAPGPRPSRRPLTPEDGGAAYAAGGRRCPPLRVVGWARDRWLRDYDAAEMRALFGGPDA